jgi:hypothetical protein
MIVVELVEFIIFLKQKSEGTDGFKDEPENQHVIRHDERISQGGVRPMPADHARLTQVVSNTATIAPRTPPLNGPPLNGLQPRSTLLADRSIPDAHECAVETDYHAPSRTLVREPMRTDVDTMRYHGNLAVAIRQRIESRIGGRIRDLMIRVSGNTIFLEGSCATYYSKQLAQHAALGVIEDENLENDIVVRVPK